MSAEVRRPLTDSREEIFVVLERGMVREIVGEIPANLQITVLDLDVEGIDPQCLQISPLNGAACLITKF